MRKNIYFLLILLIFGILTRFFWVGYPKEVVFDETYFGKYASNYLSGSYYFDPHPPLGKLLISGVGYVAGNREDQTDYSGIGNQYKSDIYVWYRLLPMISGVLLPIVLFFLALELGISAFGALILGALIIFENSLVVQSHFISLDSMLYLFGFSSLWLYLLYRRSNGGAKKTYLVLSAIAAILAFSVKWTGLSFLGLIFLMEFYEICKNMPHGFFCRTKEFFKKTILFFVVGFAIYFSIFAVHFALLPNSGQGDDFMSPAFQKTLSHSRYENDQNLHAPSLLKKFIEINVEMYAVNARMNADHQYSSKWYTWPLMQRPVFYWQGSVNDGDASRSYIYFIGNPIIYWLSSGAVAVLFLFLFWKFFNFLKSKIFHNKYVGKSRDNFIFIFIMFGFLINFLPFVFIGRVMFLYHYGGALIFSMISLILAIDLLNNKTVRNILFGAILVASISLFIFFAPLTYGIPLSSSQLDDRMWFQIWL